MQQSYFIKFSLGLSLLLAGFLTVNQATLTDFSLGEPAYAAGPLCVRPGGNDGGSCACGDPFQHCRSVQRAVNVAATGDTIRVAEGNYGASQTGVSIIGSRALIDLTKGVTLEGGWQTDGSGNFTSRNAANYETTILDGENRRRVMYITGDITPTIDGFMVTKGKNNAQGAGIYVRTAHPIIANAVISGNKTTSGDSSSSSNSGGGGIFLYGATNVVIKDSTVRHNGSYVHGGGIMAYGTTTQLRLERTDISNNGSRSFGGGVYFSSGANNAALVDLLVKENSARSYGGLYLQGHDISLKNVAIQNNSSSYYGGMHLSGNNPTLNNVSLISNTASSQYGGGYISGDNASISNLTVVSNTDRSSYGYGGLYLSGNNLTLAQATITGNSTRGSYAGLHVRGSYANLSHLTLENNDAAGGYASLYLSGAFPTLSDITVAHNRANNGAAGIFVRANTSSSSRVTMTNLSVYNNASQATSNGASGGAAGIYVAVGSSATGGSKLNLQNVSVISNSYTGSYAGMGGMYIAGYGPVLSRVTIMSNTTTSSSKTGGLHIEGGNQAVLDDLTVRYNRATKNSTSNRGGGIYLRGNNSTLRRSIIMDNYTYDRGGGIYVYGSGNVLENNIIAHNSLGSASGEGSGVFLHSNNKLLHNTIVNNTGGLGQAVYASSGTIIRNSVIADHTIALQAAGDTTLDNNVLSQVGSPGYVGAVTPTNNRYCDPDFSNAAAQNYRLLASDGCAKDFSNMSDTLTIDLDGDSRPVNGTSDAGADEATGPAAPVADFNCTPLSGVAPLNVSCTDNSTNTPTGWAWNFGDNGTSATETPSHTYNQAGRYGVTLTASNNAGSDGVTKLDYITVYTPCVVDFTATPTSGPVNTVVTFTNISTGECGAWNWTFGDGESSSAENPTHTYTAEGSFTVSLSSSGGHGGDDSKSKPNYIEIVSAPVAQFSCTPLSGQTPLNVRCTNQSTGQISSYSWAFGDGGSSTAENPTHIYSVAGGYGITLTVTGPGGRDTKIETNYITVNDPCVANFTATPTAGAPPLTVQFTNQSTGECGSWVWNFSDGSTSNQQNPSHVFINEGRYTVTLTASGSGGTSQFTDTISVGALAADFEYSPTSGAAPLTVVFTDTSASVTKIVTWQWQFGDGQTSTEQNPSHTFDDTQSVYNVTLIVEDSTGNQASKTQPVTIIEGVTVSCQVLPLSGLTPLTVALSHQALAYDTLLWDLGDGTTSTDPNLSQYRYDQPGQYTITLTAYQGETEKKAVCGLVEAKPVIIPIQADFAGDPLRSSNPPLTVQFTDWSTGGPFTGWLWDFGDGTTSTLPNPSHTYDRAGSFTVSLTVTGTNGVKRETKPSYINLTAEPIAPPVAGFVAQPTRGSTPLRVVFTSTAQGAVSSQTWDFGDGHTGRGSEIEHTYTQPGTFTVVLTVTGPGGSDSTSQIIQAEAACQAAFEFTPKTGQPPLEINIDNQSTACQSYLWDFGDGTTSTEISPRHVFTPAGSYVIGLTATGVGNRDSITQTIVVGDKGCYFTATPTSGFQPLNVEFEAENCQPGTFFIWDFGDGESTSGDAESVTHIYELAGTFSISMSSLPPNGSREEDVLPNYITVAPPSPTCMVDFGVSFNPPQPSDPPVQAIFDNRSTDDCVSYVWHFGDESSSIEPNPVYTYTQKGVYTVSLVGHGTVTKSQRITIGDLIKPDPITVTIIPATATRQDDLEVKITHLGDEPDGVEIRWLGNGTPQGSLDNDRVVPAIFTKNGEAWCVTVTPYKADSTGKRVYGPAVGPICRFIENSPPEARNLQLRPANPSTNDSLAAAYDYFDANDDPEGATKIRWYRGEILQSMFNDEKAIPSSATIEGETWCVRVTPHDGKLEGEMGEHCTPISPPTNGLPRVIVAAIRPIPANDHHTLQLFYLYQDPDDDPEGQTQIRWYRNRQYQPGFFGQRQLSASATHVGDEWFAIIRPHDGQDFGSPFATLPLKIITTSNIAPVVDEVTISPNRPGVEADLVLKYATSDLNDDPVSVKIRWFKNGTLQPAYNDQNSVPATATSLGDSWYAIIIPSDGQLEGNPVPARSVLVRQVTENSPPQASNVFLAPAEPGDNQPLRFHYTYIDEDADQEGETQISWQLNGQVQSALANQSAVPVAMTAKGQEWCVTVRPHDGREYGETVASNCVTIGEYINTNPVALNVEILPPLPRSSDDLTLSYTFFDPDNHAEGNTEIKWYKIVKGDEIYQAAFDGQTTIPAIVTAPGEQWYATVRPNDDQPSSSRGLGELKKSNLVKINQPPTLDTVSIMPPEPTAGQALILRQTGFADNDSEISCPAQIRWSVNDASRGEYDDQDIIPPDAITAGQVWQATVSPNDCLEYGLPIRTNVVTVTVCEGACRSIGATYLPILIRQQADTIPTPTPIPLGPYEENDGVAEAYGPLNFNQRYEAYAEDEHDWYTVSLSETTSLQISVTNFVVPGILAVYNSDLHVLATVEANNQSLLLPATSGSFILSNLPPGEYYLQIRATDTVDMNTRYQLELSQRSLSYEKPLP